jgi:uncharacterized protein YdeI (YjbR/CyaY-like superfamily)
VAAPIEPVFFATPAAFRAWLDANHATARELLVGFHRKGSGRPSITWPESVAEALCVGWIDGVRRSVDDERYTIRFSPRKAGSTWSAVNIALMERLLAEGRVREAGRRAFERRTTARSGIYAYEQDHDAVAFDAESERRFRSHRAAWAYFQARPASYRKTAIWRVMSAKRPETRARRLAELIACSAEGRTIPSLTRAKPR